MKQKFFVLSAIALLAVVGLFVFEHATSAQRPNRDAQPGQGQQRGNRPGGERSGRDMMARFNPTSFVDNSWLDLSFRVKVSDETLLKARPMYQAALDKFEEKMKEIRQSDDIRAAFAEMRTFSQDTIKELQTGLKKVLTGEELTKLTELMKKRETDRQNRFRGGQGGQRGGQGGQRGGQGGQRPSQ